MMPGESLQLFALHCFPPATPCRGQPPPKTCAARLLFKGNISILGRHMLLISSDHRRCWMSSNASLMREHGVSTIRNSFANPAVSRPHRTLFFQLRAIVLEGAWKHNCGTISHEIGFGAKKAARSSSKPSCPNTDILINMGLMNNKPKSLAGRGELGRTLWFKSGL